MSLKRWDLEALKEERPNVSSLGHLKMESQQEAFKEETPKEENNEECGRDQPPMLLTQDWFWYTREHMEGISGTAETLE